MSVIIGFLGSHHGGCPICSAAWAENFCFANLLVAKICILEMRRTGKIKKKNQNSAL